MKKGTFVILFSSLAFTVFVAVLLIQQSQDKGLLRAGHLGEKSFVILNEVLVERKVNFYVSQSLRNSAYAALQDLSQQGFFPRTLDGKQCPVIENKPVLFSDSSCVYTQKNLEQTYLTLVHTHFLKALQQPVYGIPLSSQQYTTELTKGDGWLQVEGSGGLLSYTGKTVAYRFPITYKEKIWYDLHHFTLLLTTAENNLGCLSGLTKKEKPFTDEEYAAAVVQQCKFSDAFTWQAQKKGDILFLTARTKDKVLFLENIQFSFAITLNNMVDVFKERQNIF